MPWSACRVCIWMTLFRHPNISVSVGLKSFCPWCLKLDGNTKIITIHLCEVHYMMAIVCDICWVFTCMSAQSILGHFSGCKAKHDKECTEHEGPAKAHKKKESVMRKKGGIPVTQSRCCQEVMMSRMPLYIICLVKPVNISQFTA